MDGVPEIIQMMLDHQMEETRRLLQQNREEATIPIVQPELVPEQSEEGNYTRPVSQARTQRERRNGPERINNKDGWTYKNFLSAKPPGLSGSLKPVEIMDWISEMEMVFESCNCSDKHKTVFAVRQLKTKVLRWWKLLAYTMPKGETSNMSWEDFLVHLKMQHSSKLDLPRSTTSFRT